MGPSKTCVVKFIRKGEKGDKGDPGQKGEDGKSYTLKGHADHHAEKWDQVDGSTPSGLWLVDEVDGNSFQEGDEQARRYQGTNDDIEILPVNVYTGDGYIIGKNLWVWNGSSWQNIGEFTGPQGPKGDDAVVVEVNPSAILHKKATTKSTYVIAVRVKDGENYVSEGPGTNQFRAAITLPTGLDKVINGNPVGDTTNRFWFSIAANASVTGSITIDVTYKNLTRTKTISFATVADGQSIQGKKGPMPRGPQYFDQISDGYQFYAGVDDEDIRDIVVYNNNYYTCIKTHIKGSDDVTTNSDGTKVLSSTYWHLGAKMDLVATYLLLAQYALIKNLGVETIDMRDKDGNVLFQAKDGNVLCKTGTFENVTVTGNLKGVSGTFYKLSALNNVGQEAASIYFSNEGRLTFEGDIYNQGHDGKRNRSYRFYSSDIWCRGGFGAAERNTLLVKGSYGYYYVNGVDKAGIKVNFDKATYGKTTYYKLACYGRDGDYAGFPVDTIIFQCPSAYYYDLIAFSSQRIMCVNGNDKQAIGIFSNGNVVSWNGGEIAEVIKIPLGNNFFSPAKDQSIPGVGLLIGAFRDNNWS